MPYTPQLNGVAKRFNQTLVEMAWCMLHNKGLTMGENQATTTYLNNRSPNNCLEGVIPLEAWNGEKPNVGNFKKISNIAFVHKPKRVNSKVGFWIARPPKVYLWVTKGSHIGCGFQFKGNYALTSKDVLVVNNPQTPMFSMEDTIKLNNQTVEN
jgi:hypothetical protein